MRNSNELQNEFANISKLLIDKSMQLQCYVPMGFRGRVGWTFSSIKKEPVVEKPEPIKVKKQKKVFLGVNAGVGAGFYSYSLESHDMDGYNILYEEGGDFSSFPFNAGVDFAFRLTDSFYLGAYGSIGMLPWVEDVDLLENSLSPSFGLLTLFNQKNEKAIIIGAGTCMPNFSTFGMNFRIGYKFKNNLYLFGEFTKYSYDGNYYYSVNDDLNVTSFSFFLHFGYRIF